MDRRVDLALAIIVTLYGLALVAATTLQAPGPELDPVGKQGLPYGVGAFLAAVGATLVVRRLTTWSTENSNIVYEEGAEDEPGHPASAMGPLLVGGAILAYVLLLPVIGFLIGTPLFMIVSLWVLDRRGAVMLGAVPLAFTLITFAVFSQLLAVPLPVGPLNDLLVELGVIDAIR